MKSGVKHEVRIAAVNEYGISPWSDTVAFLTPVRTHMYYFIYHIE